MVQPSPFEQEMPVMSAFIEALRILAALYGFGARGQRRRPDPIYIGRADGRGL